MVSIDRPNMRYCNSVIGVDLSWGITDEDTFEFMENMLSVMKGKVDEVHEEIEGVNDRKRKDALQHGILSTHSLMIH